MWPWLKTDDIIQLSVILKHEKIKRDFLNPPSETDDALTSFSSERGKALFCSEKLLDTRRILGSVFPVSGEVYNHIQATKTLDLGMLPKKFSILIAVVPLMDP